MIAEFIDPAILGFILVGVMLFAIFVGFPISFTLIFLGFVFGYLGFVQESIMRSERGMDTAWMPYMWPIKLCLLIGIILLLIQGVSELFKSYWAATRGKWPGDNK